MKRKKIRILYFYTAESPFVAKDIEILKSQHEVKPFFFNVYHKRRLFHLLFAQFFFLIKHFFSSELIMCQFAGLHSVQPVLFAKLFFKKAIIVSGGTDCVSFPSINYGNFSNKGNWFLTKLCFKNASLILPVHASLIECDYTYQTDDYPRQGIKYFIPELKTRCAVVHNGYDSAYWKKGEQLKTQRSFITVLGHVNSKFTLKLKGIDLFIHLARTFPDCSFTILGGKELLIDHPPKNLELLSNIWGEKLIDLFASKQFYVQLSISEGFPNALSEAMLCECVPIVSYVGGMPDIVGETGFILKRKDETELINLVKSALERKDLEQLGAQAREKVASQYTFENRKEKMLKEVEQLFS